MASAEALFALRHVLDIVSLHPLTFSGFVPYLAVFELATLALVLTYCTFTYDMPRQHILYSVYRPLTGI